MADLAGNVLVDEDDRDVVSLAELVKCLFDHGNRRVCKKSTRARDNGVTWRGGGEGGILNAESAASFRMLDGVRLCDNQQRKCTPKKTITVSSMRRGTTNILQYIPFCSLLPASIGME